MEIISTKFDYYDIILLIECSVRLSMRGTDRWNIIFLKYAVPRKRFLDEKFKKFPVMFPVLREFGDRKLRKQKDSQAIMRRYYSAGISAGEAGPRSSRLGV
jgi:hypothetical protein